MTTPMPSGPETPDRLMASSCSKCWFSGFLVTYWRSSWEDAALLDGGAMPKPEFVEAAERHVLLY